MRGAPTPRIDQLAADTGLMGLYEAGNGLVEHLGILIGTGEHHAA
jgi:hypothetical protein